MVEPTKLPVKTEKSSVGAPQLWRPFESVRREIDHLFQDFGGDFWRAPFRQVERAFGAMPAVRQIAISTGALLVVVAALNNSAHALSMQECSAKYKAAKEAGTLGGMKWNDFRKAQCGADATAAPAPSTTPSAAPSAPTATSPKSTAAKPSLTPAPAATGNAVFPSAVSPKYSGESAGKARMQTCLDQYRANKATNGNGGLKWIEKGGGYYSECNKRLKGAA